MRPAATKPGERPYLIARIALNRELLLEAAGAALSKVVAGARFGNYLRPCPAIAITESSMT